MYSSYTAASKVKSILSSKYMYLEWFRGISIKHDCDDGYYITVYIAEGHIPTIPKELHEVTIKIETRGMIIAL